MCLCFDVATLYAFGSRGREALDWLHGRVGAMSGESDVDVGVRPVSGQVWTLDEKVKMAIAFEHLLGCGRVDLVALPEADPTSPPRSSGASGCTPGTNTPPTSTICTCCAGQGT